MLSAVCADAACQELTLPLVWPGILCPTVTGSVDQYAIYLHVAHASPVLFQLPQDRRWDLGRINHSGAFEIATLA